MAERKRALVRKCGIDMIEEAHRSGSWGDLTAKQIRVYIQVLRTIANSKSLSLPATRARARVIMRDRGIAMAPEKPRPKLRGTIPEDEHRRMDASYVGIVRRQKKRLEAALRLTDIVQIKDAVPSMYDAAEALVHDGTASLISDTMHRPRRGRFPANETMRREYRVMCIGPGDTHWEERI